MPKNLIATDPPVSEQQRKAMEAAAHGHSTLGIPKKVGQEFVGNDDAGHAAGIMYVAPDGDVLLLRRAGTQGVDNYVGHWALPGGTGEDGETPGMTAMRESDEEIGAVDCYDGAMKTLDQRTTPTGMAFHTFAQPVGSKFAPTLNDEHSGYCWAGLDSLPQPMHPAVAKTISERLGKPANDDGTAADMTGEEWSSLRTNFAKWTREEEKEAEHKPAADSKHGIAMDKKSIREYDQDGHLLVKMTPISKANVCPYFGREIPGSDEMGLDPDETYMLLRDPDELAKAAPTAQGKPVLLIHTAISADDHPREVTVGAVAGNAEFKAPYLMAPLSVWDGEGIDLIESDKQKQISCAYHYRCDLTPGEYEGEHYDGVMRDIAFNHVALVEEGRAGPDVVVGDSKPRMENGMTTRAVALSGASVYALGALRGYLQPKLAKDAKISLAPALKGLTSKNFGSRKKKLAADVKLAVDGKMSKDASLDDVTAFLDCLEKEVEGVDSMEAGAGMGTADKPRGMDAEDPKRKFLEGKLSAEDMKALDEMDDSDEGESEAMDEEDEEAKKKAAAAKAEDEKEDEPMVSKKAMDSAISSAVNSAVKSERKNNVAIAEARELAMPYVGKIALACDSAPAVFRAALEAMKVDITDVPDAALRHILLAQQVPGAKRQAFDEQPRRAYDAAPTGYDFTEMFKAKPTQIA